MADQDFKYGVETIRYGFMVIKAQWLQYFNTDIKGIRTYKLLPGERFLNINSLLRIEKLSMDGVGSTFTLGAD